MNFYLHESIDYKRSRLQAILKVYRINGNADVMSKHASIFYCKT